MLALHATLTGHSARVWHVCWHPTLPLLATCGEDRTVRVWSPTPSAALPPPPPEPAAPAAPAPLSSTWQCIHTLEDFATRTVRACEWSPCGRFLAACSFDSNTTVWRVGGGALAAGAQAGVLARGGCAPAELTFDVLAVLDGHENEVKGVAWSASGELLATCGRDKSVWLWEAVDEGADFECIAVLHGHEGDVKALAWHPTRDVLASASYDDSLRLWGEGGEDWCAVQALPSAHGSTVWACAWEGGNGSSATRRLASVGEDGALRVWAAAEAGGAGGVAEAVALSAAGAAPAAHAPRSAFSVHWAAEGVAWGAGSGAGSGADGAGAGSEALLATCGADDALRVWSVPAGGSEAPVQRACVGGAHGGLDVNSVRWHRALPVLATGGDDYAVRVWRWEGGAGEARAAS